MITKEQFTEKVMKDLKRLMPQEILDKCEVKKVVVTKDNDTQLTGICFNRGEGLPCPTFYVEAAYEAYIRGESYYSLINGLVESAVEHWNVEVPIDVNDLGYEKMKDKLVFQIVDSDRNKNRLRELVSSDVASGLALIYRFEIKAPGGVMSIPITKDMAASFGYDLAVMDKDARANMQRIYPATLTTPTEEIKEMATGEQAINLLEIEAEMDDKGYLLKNDSARLGSSALFYPDMMEKIGNKLKENYYVLPTSTNEIMIVPTTNTLPARELMSMLKQGNELFTTNETILSDKLFMYDRGNRLLAQVTVPNREVEMER